MLGQYAGFFTRAAAMLIDILVIVIALIFIMYSRSACPYHIFLGVDPNTCSASNTESLLPQIGASIYPRHRTRTQWLCGMVDFVWTIPRG